MYREINMSDKFLIRSLCVLCLCFGSEAKASFPFIDVGYTPSENIKWTEVDSDGPDTVSVDLPDEKPRYFHYEYIPSAGQDLYSSQQTDLSGNVNADFVESHIAVGSGGAVYNHDGRDISKISGAFVNNAAALNGGAIENQGADFGDIRGDFVGNHLENSTIGHKGGAIYNSTETKIKSLLGNFIGNYINTSGSAQGGAIFSNQGFGDIYISQISGNFVDNEIWQTGPGGLAWGGAVSLYETKVDKMRGNYINNSINAFANAGGGAWSLGNTDVPFVEGVFIHNSVVSTQKVKGGAVMIYDRPSVPGDSGYPDYTRSFTNHFTAKFIDNFISSVNDTALGGAMLFSGDRILDFQADFKDNYAISEGGNVLGGALYNSGKIDKIHDSSFVGNSVQSPLWALGGAVANGGTIGQIVNSSFIGNYAKSDTLAKGGAIFSVKNLELFAQGQDFVFDGNYVEVGGVKKSNAIYMEGEDVSPLALNLNIEQGGNFKFADGIDGVHYDINIKSDGSGEALFADEIEGVRNFNLFSGAVVHLGVNSRVFVQNMTAESVSAQRNQQSPILMLDLETDKLNNQIKSPIIKVEQDIQGAYQVVINSLNKEVLEGAPIVLVPFLQALNDDVATSSSFSVARVIGSPYMWQGAVNANGETSGSTWYLTAQNTPTPVPEPVPVPDPDPIPIPTPEPDPVPVEKIYTPEVIAAIGLHEVAIEQNRSLMKNVLNQGKRIEQRERKCSYPQKCPQSNAWVYAQGESGNLDKPLRVDADLWGIEGGFDVLKNQNQRLGVFASYRDGEYDFTGRGAKYRSSIGADIDIESYSGGLYYAFEQNQNWVSASVFGGLQQADFKTDDGIAKFDSDGTQFGAGLEFGHRFELGNHLGISPILSLYYTQISYDKTQDKLGKTYRWKNIDYVETEFALSLDKVFTNGAVYLAPSIVQTLSTDDKMYVNDLSFENTYHDQTIGRLELGGVLNISENLSGYIWTNYSFASSYESLSGGLGISYLW